MTSEWYMWVFKVRKHTINFISSSNHGVAAALVHFLAFSVHATASASTTSLSIEKLLLKILSNLVLIVIKSERCMELMAGGNRSPSLLWINFPTFNFRSYLIRLFYFISDRSGVWYYVRYYKVQGHMQYTHLTHGQCMHHCTLRHSTADTCI